MGFQVRLGALALLFALTSAGLARAGLPLLLDFSSPPVPAPGDQTGISSYEEDGFVIKPLGPLEIVTPFRLRMNGGDAAGFAHNGSPYLQLALGDSFEAVWAGGQLFTPTQLDLAEYSTSFNVPISVEFTGYFSGGGNVTTTFLLDGLIDGAGGAADFQTFFFPGSFADIVRLESTTNVFSMDNLVVSVIPEPSAGLLVLIGLGLLGASHRRRN